MAPQHLQTLIDESLAEQLCNLIFELKDKPESDFPHRLAQLVDRGLNPNTPALLWLTDEGVDGLLAQPHWLSPLAFACSTLAASLIPALLEFCDPNLTDQQGRSPLMRNLAHVCGDGGDAKLSRQIFDALLPRSRLDLVDRDGQDALMIAASSAKSYAIEPLLAAGSNPILRDRNAQDALTLALVASEGSTSQKHLMQGPLAALAHVSDLEGSDCRGRTPAHWAVGHRDRDVVALICPPHAMTRRDLFGRTPLMLAARATESRHIELILQSSDPAAVDPCGRDALMIAIEYGRDKQAAALAHVSDLTLTDFRGERAIDKARLFDRSAIFQILEPLDLAQNEAKTLRLMLEGDLACCASRL